MAKEDLVEGIKLAIAKGWTLREAMMSFYNAGYPREDIEEAAKAIQFPSFSQLSQTASATQTKTSAKPAQKTVQKQAVPAKKYQALTPNPKQKVSNYNYIPSKTPIVVLTTILILLVIALIAIFIFRDQLTTILNGLIG